MHRRHRLLVRRCDRAATRLRLSRARLPAGFGCDELRARFVLGLGGGDGRDGNAAAVLLGRLLRARCCEPLWRCHGTRCREAPERDRCAPPLAAELVRLRDRRLLGGMGWSSWSFLHEIRHETLVVCGDDDPLVPLVNARMLAARIPRATLEVVERAGHLLLWDEPERIAPQIGHFVGWGREEVLYACPLARFRRRRHGRVRREQRRPRPSRQLVSRRAGAPPISAARPTASLPTKVLEAKSLITRGAVYQLGHVYEAGMPMFGTRHFSLRIPQTFGPLGSNRDDVPRRDRERRDRPSRHAVRRLGAHRHRRSLLQRQRPRATSRRPTG